MKRTEFELHLKERSLHGQYYSAEQPVAVVVIVHGMGEYGARYERTVVPKFLNNSISVLSYDQFGHGRSHGKKGHHPGYEYLLDSLELMVDKAIQIFNTIPVFVYGHSMGGNVVINYSLKRPDKVKGFIVTSPFLKLAFKIPGWKVFFGKALNQLWPSLTLPSELDVDAISRDPSEVEAYSNDPQIHDRVSAAYSLEIIKKGEWALSNAEKLQHPMIILHGTGDMLTDYKSSEEFAQKAGSIVEYVPMAEGYHELHHDLDKEIVLEKIISWILKQ